ncbi:hypothetical protein R6Z07F_000560 [Ovis aries]
MDTNTILVLSTCFASFFTFQIIFHIVSYWFSAKISPGFNNLNFKKKIEWNSRVVSTCHSLVVGVVGLYIFLFDEAGIADPLWGDTSLGKVNIAIASGYLISDLLILIWYWKVIGDKYFVMHHCTALYAYHFVLKDGVLVYIGNFRLLAELSSPFVNQRWFFEALKYPKFSKANVINGILMTAVFFIVRIASIPPFYSYMYSVFGTEAYGTRDLLENHSTPCNWSHYKFTILVIHFIKIYSLGTRHHAKQKVNNTVGNWMGIERFF